MRNTLFSTLSIVTVLCSGILSVPLFLLTTPALAQPFREGRPPEPFSSNEDPLYTEIFGMYGPRSRDDARKMLEPVRELANSIERRGLEGTDLSFFGRGDAETMGEFVIETVEKAKSRKLNTVVRIPEWPHRQGEKWVAQVYVGTDTDMYREELWELTLKRGEGDEWEIDRGKIVAQQFVKYRHGSIDWIRYTIDKPFVIRNDRLRLEVQTGELYLGRIPGELGGSFMVYIDGEVNAILVPPTEIEREQLRRKGGSERFSAEVRDVALQYERQALIRDFPVWPLTEERSSGDESRIGREWFRYFSNETESIGDYNDKFSPLFHHPQDFLAVFRRRIGNDIHFYRVFGENPDFPEEIIFGKWLNPATHSSSRDQFKGVRDNYEIFVQMSAIAGALSGGGLSELQSNTSEMLRDYLDSLASQVSYNYSAPELLNHLNQMEIGRPHWDEAQASNIWELPEYTDSWLWEVWCQYDRPEDRYGENLPRTLRQRIIREREDKRPFQIHHAKVRCDVESGSDFTCEARIEMTTLRDIPFAMHFDLNPAVEVRSIVDPEGRHLFHDRTDEGIRVVLPETLQSSKDLQLHFLLVLPPTTSASAAASTSMVTWLPDQGFLSPKTSDVLISVPQRQDVVATGDLVSRYEAEGRKYYHHRTEMPLPGPSFSFGTFQNRNDPVILTDVELQGDNTEDGLLFRQFLDRDTRLSAVELPRLFSAEFEGDVEAQDTIEALQALEGQYVETSNWTEMIRLKDNAKVYLEALSKNFGPYPHRTYSVIEPEFMPYSQYGYPGYTLVNSASLTPGVSNYSASTRFVLEPHFNDYYLSHEIARQWWQFRSTSPNPRDRWLPIALNQLSAAWLIQSTYGNEDYGAIIQRWDQWSRLMENNTPLWLGYQRANPAETYHLLYHKGAMVLHMLRMMLPQAVPTGEEIVFNDLIRTLNSEINDVEGGGGVTTSELQEMVENILGAETMQRIYGRSSLDWFFEQWVFRAGYPRLEFEVDETRTPGTDETKVAVTVRQTQPGEPYVLPAHFYAKHPRGKESVRRVIIDEKEQTFEFTFDDRVRQFSFDKNHHLLCSVSGIRR